MAVPTRPLNLRILGGGAPSTGLITQADFTYVGAFKVPFGTSQQHTFDYGGQALMYWPAHNSLLMGGHDWYQEVGEMSIPTPATGPTLASLLRATLLQPFTDILQGLRLTIDGDTYNGVKLGGMLISGSSLVVSAWSYYDASPAKQTRTHFVTGQNFAALGTTTGPFQVGLGFPPDLVRIGGFVSGYMTPIPSVWQAALGGTHLTGQGGQISVLTRTSAGPSATVFTPTDLGATIPAPGTIVMGYPNDSSNPGSALNHPTLGNYGVDGGLYNGTQGFRGMIFPENTRSILFFGSGSPNFCYGMGTSNPALAGQPVPGQPGAHYCYDPVPNGNFYGVHNYPSQSLVFAYDVNDFIAVKQGSKQPWEVIPYATWYFTLPFQSNIVNGIETGSFGLNGAAYDPATKRVFLSAVLCEGAAPIVHVLTLP